MGLLVRRSGAQNAMFRWGGYYFDADPGMRSLVGADFGATQFREAVPYCFGMNDAPTPTSDG